MGLEGYLGRRLVLGGIGGPRRTIYESSSDRFLLSRRGPALLRSLAEAVRDAVPEWNIAYDLSSHPMGKGGVEMIAVFSSPQEWVTGIATFQAGSGDSVPPPADLEVSSNRPLLSAQINYNLSYLEYGGVDPRYQQLKRAVGIGVLGWWGYYVREGRLLLPKTTGTRF